MLDILGTGEKFSPRSIVSRKFPAKFCTEMANAVLDGDSGKLLEYRPLMKYPKYKEVWGTSFGNEVGRFAQGMPGRVSPKKATNTLFFINESEVPRDRLRDITYGRIV